jgi:formylglycine-generating enzyme required for sulfatase activity
MFAIKYTPRVPIQLILFGALSWVSYALAQQSPEQADDAESRRVERLGEASTEEWEMDLRLPKAAPAAGGGVSEPVLPDEEQNRELQQLLSKLAANPGDKSVLGQLDNLLMNVLDQVDAMLDAGALDEAEPLIALIQAVDPGLSGFKEAEKRLQSLRETDELIKAGDAALAAGHVLEPPGESAVDFFNRALEKDPQSETARAGLVRAQGQLIEHALAYARELDFESADGWLLAAAGVLDNPQAVENARSEVAEFKRERAGELQQKVIDAMNAGAFEQADFGIIELMALGGQESLVQSLMARLEEARLYGGFGPGQIISDELRSGGSAPPVVIIDAGTFMMGSRARSDDVNDHEEPRHRVLIKRGFGLGVTEVTVAQFRLFIERTGYKTGAEISGSSSIYDETAGRLNKRNGVNWRHDYRGKEAEPELPVLHVNVNDAEAYLQWLSLETGKRYRLPSEAEYEYVARAGGKGPYWWGEGPPAEVVENLTGERDKSPSKREWTTFFKKYGDGHWGPAPAGSLRSDALVHPMGVYDIAGNVSEWVADCWHDNYVKAPTDGSAWFNRGCDRRVVRGGYWASAPEQSRAAFRFPAKSDSFGPVMGFRVARDL